VPIAALLRRLDSIRLQAIEIGDLTLDMLSHHRLQEPGAHLDGLLDHIVESTDLQWREEVLKIRYLGLRSCLLHALDQQFLAGWKSEARPPFSVAAVEDEDLGSLCQAEDIGEVVEMLRLCVNPNAGCEIILQEKPLHSKVGAHFRSPIRGRTET
jgi:hypothetical protein